MFKGAVLRYLISDALSLLGNSIAGVVLPLVLLARTGDVLAAGTLALICAVPQFACGILGGALLDRANRKRVCAASDLISALSVALLPIIDATVGLSFGWFVALGLLGAVGDVPGMTARDALLPEVCEHEGADLQRFVGASQSLNALIGIAGPAVAALLIGFMNDVDALWITATCSCAAALVTATLPHGVGEVRTAPELSSGTDDPTKGEQASVNLEPHNQPDPSTNPISQPCALAAEPESSSSAPLAQRLLALGRSVLTDGLRTLFAGNRLLRATTLLSFGITMVMAAWQGIVLPAYFTVGKTPELAGVFVSAMGIGMLMGSLVYTALAARFSRRGWFVLSLIGMAAGVCIMGTLPGTLALLASAAAVGFFSGPASALLGFFAYELIPEATRGSAMGTLNALYLIVAPAGTFLGSIFIARLGIPRTCLVLACLWIVVSAIALASPTLRDLDGKPQGYNASSADLFDGGAR